MDAVNVMPNVHNYKTTFSCATFSRLEIDPRKMSKFYTSKIWHYTVNL